jgi:hypothetical protein
MPLSRINSASIANSAVIAADIADGTITAAKIISVANTQITGNIVSSQIAPSVTLTTPLISGNLNLDSAGTTGIRVPSANTLSFYEGGVEAVRIDSSGRVGIGCTPTQKLQIEDSANLTLQITKTGVASFSIVNNGTSGTILQNEANPLILSTNNTERMRIDSSGRITMSAQPFSHAYGGSQTVNAGSVILQFSATLVNQGNHYNTSTYTFTAPIAGDYLVMIGIRRDSGQTSGYSRFTVFKNGTAQAVDLKIHDPISVLNTSSLSNQSQNAILRLAANDYLQVQDYGSSSYPTVYNLAESHFMVRLLG